MSTSIYLGAGQTKWLAPPGSQAEMAPRLQAGRVARQARHADVGSYRVDCARGRTTDHADQGGTADARAAHAALALGDERGRDARKLCVAFEREAWPVGRIGAARAATATGGISAHPIARRVLRLGRAGKRCRSRLGRDGLRGPRERGPHCLVGDHRTWMVPTAILPVLRSSWVSKETFWPSL